MIITDWTDENTEKFQTETFRIKHDLISTGLFSDEALSELLDKHPKDQLDVCALSVHLFININLERVMFGMSMGKPLLRPSKRVKFG